VTPRVCATLVGYADPCSEGVAYVPEGVAPPPLSFSRHLTGRWWEFYFPD